MRRTLDLGLPILGVLGLIAGGVLGLVVAPGDRDMGDVYRIMYVHVPAAWAALLAVTVTFVASLVYLFKGSFKADAVAEASAEVGVFFGALLIVLGSIWARPTWGVWWDWDPRLTTAAILLFAFAGYLALRRFVDDPERRATWSAVAAIVADADVPILWSSVRWWRSLHQPQNTAASTHSVMSESLWLNAAAFILLAIWFIRLRARVAERRLAEELAEPPPEEAPAKTSMRSGA